jgi:hypothetical protein
MFPDGSPPVTIVAGCGRLSPIWGSPPAALVASSRYPPATRKQSGVGNLSKVPSGINYRPVPEGSHLRFPTPDNLLIAQGYLLDATRVPGDPQLGEKWPRPDALRIGGEQSLNTAAERDTSYTVDLDGVRHATRSLLLNAYDAYDVKP